MRALTLIPLIVLSLANRSACEVIVVRLGEFDPGACIVSVDSKERHIDIIESDIVSPAKYTKYWANLALIPDKANERFKSESGRYMILLLDEEELEQKLRAGLLIFISKYAVTHASSLANQTANPATMTYPDELKSSPTR